jgi:hypothetical protein
MPIAPEVYKKIVTAKVYIDDNFRNFAGAASPRSDSFITFASLGYAGPGQTFPGGLSFPLSFSPAFYPDL